MKVSDIAFKDPFVGKMLSKMLEAEEGWPINEHPIINWKQNIENYRKIGSIEHTLQAGEIIIAMREIIDHWYLCHDDVAPNEKR